MEGGRGHFGDEEEEFGPTAAVGCTAGAFCTAGGWLLSPSPWLTLQELGPEGARCCLHHAPEQNAPRSGATVGAEPLQHGGVTAGAGTWGQHPAAVPSCPAMCGGHRAPPAPSSPCLILTTSGLHRSRAPHPRAPWFGVCEKCLAYGKNTIVMWVWGFQHLRRMSPARLPGLVVCSERLLCCCSGCLLGCRAAATCAALPRDPRQGGASACQAVWGLLS